MPEKEITTALNKSSLADRITYCIGRIGTQEDFAERANISNSMLSRYAKGSSDPSTAKISKIAETAGVSLLKAPV